jgi:hypothetical protein
MIPVEQIARLAELYDRFNNALDPFSEECRRAKDELEASISNLHSAHASDVSFSEFRCELIRHCREYLRKNKS